MADESSLTSRRRALKCLAFGGAGTLFALTGGVFTPIDVALAAADPHSAKRLGKPLFVQISDTHIGFNKDANPDVNGTLARSIELVNAMPEHLTDVVSSDRHTVKPWFAGHADVSPVVVDFATQGYRLVGGRADFFEQQRVAAVVYQHGAHLINVFSWVAGRPALPEFSSRSGYHIACWRDANLQSCAVSDTGWDELQGLTRLLRERGAGAPAPE